MASIYPQPKMQFFTNNGDPAVGYKLYTYEPGSAFSVLKDTYSDDAGTPNTNPVIMDARGEASVFWDGEYDVKLTTDLDTLVWTQTGIGLGGLTVTDGGVSVPLVTALSRRSVEFPSMDALRLSTTNYDYVTVASFYLGSGKGSVRLRRSGSGSPTGSGAAVIAAALAAGTFCNASGIGYVVEQDQFITAYAFGAVGSNTAGDAVFVQAMVTWAQNVGGAEIHCVKDTYSFGDTTLTLGGDGVKFYAYGATFRNARIQIGLGATNTAIFGGKVTSDTSSSAWYDLEVFGTYFVIQDLELEKSPITGGVMAYFRRQCAFGKIRGLAMSGSNGIFISGHDLSFVGCNLESKGVDGVSGTDDCYVLKAGDSTNPSVQTYNISIVGGNVRGFYNILAIGSEIGQYAVDGDYSNYVRNVTVTGVNAFNCVTLAYIKPGATGLDFRHGLVDNVTMSNCNLFNTLPMINWPFEIRVGRGAIVRNVTITNCNIFGRCNGTALTHSCIELSGMNLGASATIEDITFENISCRDSYGGVPNSGPTPGEPFDWVIRINRTSAANDTIQRVKFRNIKQYGSEQGGMVIENNPQGPIELYDSDFLQSGITPSAGSFRGIFGVTSATSMVIKNNKIETGGSQLPAGATNFAADCDVDIVDIGSSAAGANFSGAIWVAPVNSYVWKIELIDGAGIAQNNVDFLTFTVRNMVTASDLPTANTTLTGLNLTAATAVAMQANSYTTTPAYFTKGTVMRLTTTNSGAGRAITNMRARVHYMRYGR